MKKLSCLFILSFLFWGNSWANEHKNILLLLGSANPDVLTRRVNVAAQLYRTRPMDAIIVSGGCGAHGSKICEASAMALQLKGKGVPMHLIFKEENSKTTVQNYIFSRRLKDKDGQRIILPGDTVYVVSDHWHAISVAARLEKYDGVIARFFIEGTIQPKPEDRLDYAAIFNGYADNHLFTLKGTWLTPEAVWTKKDTLYYLTQDIIYATDVANNTYSVTSVQQRFPFLEGRSEFNPPLFIDDITAWYILFDGRCHKVSKKDFKVLQDQPVNEWLLLPDTLNWRNFNTGYIQDNKLVLMGNEKMLLAEKKGQRFRYMQETSPDQYFINWPYAWGKGNVSAARLQPEADKVIFYRNMESAECVINQKTIGKATPLKLKWIGEIK
ncbi:YdcF family protein [Sphingobacterium sp. N143]|uniref:YdcF family protein n=1 Tax=Sphingobacterium sp. N143 TaxID=2746727 RepID=UPI0025777D6B|nr:YdcF family protein [Sphingobacterium sp. N143]MDM1295660.1 YdcF family protein [Sphingobacterium sp. N143]